MFNRKKILIICGAVLLVATIGFAGWKASNPGEKPGTPVRTATIQEKSMASQIFVNGKIISRSLVNVTAGGTGKVTLLQVKTGDAVKAGDVLCALDPGDLKFQIEQKMLQIEQQRYLIAVADTGRGGPLKSRLELTEQAEEKALREFEAREALYRAGAVSESEYNDYAYKYQLAKDEATVARVAFESGETEANAKYQLKLLESELRKLQSDLSEKEVKSPINGIVTEVNAKLHQAVLGETALFTVEDTAHMEAVTQISEFDIGKIKVGQPALIKPTGLKDVELKGIVSSVAPTARLQTTGQTRETVVEVKIDVTDSAPGLRSNFSADIVIKAEEKEKALVVPYDALYISPEGVKQVYAVVDDHIAIKPVKPGIEGDLDLEVAFEGAAAGIHVVLSPTDALKDGDKVRIMNLEEADPEK